MDTELTAHSGRGAYEEDGVTWYDAASGERIAVRLSSHDTDGAYAVVESIAAPGCCVPMHLHQNEEEHLVVLAGTYQFACEDKIFDATAGTSVTVPKGAPHAWRNLSPSPSRLLAIFTPGGFERLVQEVINAPAGKVEEVAARYGCLIVGPPIKP
jgi:mannose-6-phosphate isomerase-like protein (cupin superfamily)